MNEYTAPIEDTDRKKNIRKKAAPKKKPAPEKSFRLDLFDWIPGLKRFVRLRSFQFLVILPNLFVFHILFIAGIFGTPVGNKNIMIVFIWILWWFILIAVMVLFASRICCTLCAIPFFGDWLQRRALIKVRLGKPSVGSKISCTDLIFAGQNVLPISGSRTLLS